MATAVTAELVAAEEFCVEEDVLVLVSEPELPPPPQPAMAATITNMAIFMRVMHFVMSDS